MSHYNWMPHGGCVLWDPGVLTVSVVSNLVIAVAYFAIPIAILGAMRPVVPRYRHLFAAFITLCGMTHVMKIITVWHPVYWIEAGVETSTAIVSAMTAINLYLYGGELIRKGQADERE